MELSPTATQSTRMISARPTVTHTISPSAVPVAAGLTGVSQGRVVRERFGLKLGSRSHRILGTHQVGCPGWPGPRAVSVRYLATDRPDGMHSVLSSKPAGPGTEDHKARMLRARADRPRRISKVQRWFPTPGAPPLYFCVQSGSMVVTVRLRADTGRPVERFGTWVRLSVVTILSTSTTIQTECTPYDSY